MESGKRDITSLFRGIFLLILMKNDENLPVNTEKKKIQERRKESS